MGDVTQLIESLPSMYKALGSVPACYELVRVVDIDTPSTYEVEGRRL